MRDTTIAFTKKLSEQREKFERKLEEERQKARDVAAALTKKLEEKSDEVSETKRMCARKLRELVVSNASKLANARREAEKRSASPSPKESTRSESKTEGEESRLEGYVRRRGLFGAEILRALPKIKAAKAFARSVLPPLPVEDPPSENKDDGEGVEGTERVVSAGSSTVVSSRGTPAAHVHVSRRGSVDIEIDR